VHVPGDELSSREILLLPDGMIGDASSQNRWVLKGKTVELRWVDRGAPGGAWVDTCSLEWGRKPERLQYSGVNQRNVRISGYKGTLPPWFEKRRQELLADKVHRDQVASEIRAGQAEEEPLGIEAAREREVKIAEIGQSLLQPGIDPDAAKAAENSLLKLLPAAGGSLTPNTLFVLYDLHHLGNKRVSPAIERAWETSGFKEYFTAKVNYEREHPGHEEAEARQYEATHGGARKPNIRDLPERLQRDMMTPDRPVPDFGDTLRRVIDFDRRVEAERRLEEQQRRNNGLPPR
jgi:hypothetical protein